MISFTISGNYTDLYQLSMGEVNFLQGRTQQRACFDYSFRSVPYEGGYVLFAGLHEVLNVLEDLHFTQSDLKFLRTLDFERTYIDYLERFQFRGAIHSVPEGEVVFPNAPIVRVEGNLIEVQLVETMLLNMLNFESLVATKASRMRQVAGDKILTDFGLRRSQGPGGIPATRAAMVGGFNSTSNVCAAGLYHLDLAGTMAHSFIQSFDSELEAFRVYARAKPEGCVFLVDTYDTLYSGIPHAITVAKEMEANGRRATGIRLDSGDLAWLSKSARKMLDEAGLPYMKIVVSNQLDEFVIRSLEAQGAPIDVYGVGTRLVTGHPDAALDGVYKLSMVENEPKIKISDNILKTTLPGRKEIYRVLSDDGNFVGADVICLQGEEACTRMYHPHEHTRPFELHAYAKEPLLQKVMDRGRIINPLPKLNKVAAYAAHRLQQLPAEYKRFENPHKYKVGISGKLLDLRNELLSAHKVDATESF